MRILLSVLLMVSVCLGAINEKFSYKTFKRQSFLLNDVKDFDGTDIIGASFYQDNPYTEVFPANIKNVRFINCNLDNCKIPAGAEVIGGTNKHFRVMNDKEYWIVGPDLKPIAPRDVSKFIASGVSVSPDGIPKTMMSGAMSITELRDPVRLERKKIDSLKNDDAYLKAILIEKGAITAEEVAK
jgi:hypothetical protein